MVTTVDIDKALLSEAKEALGATTTKAAVDQALREVVMRRRQAAALDGLSEIVFDPSPIRVDHTAAATR